MRNITITQVKDAEVCAEVTREAIAKGRTVLELPEPVTAAILSDVVKAGVTFVSAVCRTDAKLKKTGNPFGQVFKRYTVNGALGYNYENSVNNQREREQGEGKEDFKAAPRPWGERLNPALVHHKGKFYMTLKVEKTSPVEYETADGEALTYDQVKPYLPAKKKSQRQGTDKEIIHREFGLDSIVSLNVTRKAQDGIPKIAMTIIPAKG